MKKTRTGLITGHMQVTIICHHVFYFFYTQQQRSSQNPTWWKIMQLQKTLKLFITGSSCWLWFYFTYSFCFLFFSCFHFFTFTLWCDTAHVILSVKVTEAEIFSVWKHHCWTWRMIIRQKSSWMETHENHYLKTSVFIWSIKTINSATSMKTWKLSKQYRHRGSRLREAAD